MTLYTKILYTPPKNPHERILTTFDLQWFFRCHDFFVTVTIFYGIVTVFS